MSPTKTTVKAAGKKNHKRLDHIPPHVRARFFFSRPQLTRHLQLFQHGFKPLRRHRYSRLISFFIWTTSHVHFFCQIGIVPLQMGQISRILERLGRLRMERDHPVQSHPRSFMHILLLGWQSRCTLVGGHQIPLAFVIIRGEIFAKGPKT